MTLGIPLLTRKAVILAGVQSGVGVPATLSGSTDAIQATEPDYSIDPSLLERKFTSADLSPFPHLIGRKLASIKFTNEIRGNGIQSSGLLADAPKLTRLLRGCGYVASAMSGDDGDSVAPVIADSKNPANTPAITWVAGGDLGAGITKPVLYTITKGATSTIVITNNDNEVDSGAGSATAIASGTPLTLSTASGITLTPTFTGSIPTGAVFYVLVLPKGIKLKPTSSGQELLTIEAYFDGLKHKITDAMGSFTISAEAGGYATIEFTFTGSFHDVVDAALPSNPVYETQIPQQVELGNVTWGGTDGVVVQAFTYDQQNTITPRPDINAKDGYKGSRITDRQPSGKINPEAALEADIPFWSDFADARPKHFVMQVGTTVGNQVCFHGPVVQTSQLAYGDRDGIRTLECDILFKRNQGDDEFNLYFC
ncbi:hypothetical protein J2J97_31785 (plasmid) [Rhizobium bangladeshense]|uniref:phage tail tube protein n=1 Tax=Rhizobium bangladeshense TaxID=1138189 RepID=UPI001A99A0C4|nr:hypothetical protein [Rhizobium bangladeshense]QSY98653.1 hypothetical protein J2J97_31785 [Rhizobium bangladeshense]